LHSEAVQVYKLFADSSSRSLKAGELAEPAQVSKITTNVGCTLFPPAIRSIIREGILVPPKVIVLAVTSIAVATVAAAAILNWSKNMRGQTPSDLLKTTRGLDEFGVTLELPYEGRSVSHVLLVNNSQHHIIACSIVFEYEDGHGELWPAQKVIAYSDLLAEKNISKLRTLLQTQPAIAPRTKWLIGMGVDPDLVMVNNNVPPLPESTQLKERGTSEERFTKLTIKLNAVVFDNGEAVGPGATQFLEHLRSKGLGG
jgi:hypothetical protein